MGEKKLRVLQVGKYYPPERGGIETHLELLCRHLAERVEVEALVANTSAADATENLDGVLVRRLGTWIKFAGAPVCPGLIPALRQTRADIVHIHAPHPAALLGYVASGCRAPLVCTYHSDIVRQRVLGKLIEPAQDFALRRAAAIISASPNLRDSSPVLIRHRARCEVVPFGVDLARCRRVDAAAVAALRSRFAAPIVLAVGRLVYYKGFEFLIRAMARVPPPATLLIVGEGPLRGALEAEISRHGLSERVQMLGSVPDLAPYYQACDLFVLPSVARSEAFGLVQLEAMACGKPVVNTRLTTGVPYVSIDGETGLTIPPGDVDALAVTLNCLLGDAALRARFGAAARERAERDFTVEKMIESTLAIYRRVVRDHPRH